VRHSRCHIEKDRNNEAIVLRRAQFREDAKECAALIDRINSSCGGVEGHASLMAAQPRFLPSTAAAGIKPCPQEAITSTLPIFGKALMIGAILAALAYVPFAQGQQLAAGDLRPGPVYCPDPQKHIANLTKAGMFRRPRAISGPEAAYWSHEVFGYVPPLDHAIVVPQTDGGTILVPCVIGPNGPMWGGEQSNRVAIDQTYRRGLATPATDEPQKRTRKGKQ
jgi:hypothetical protein